jgi:Bacterial Ig-like domain (group 3)/Divergent InlB B-repeat domain
MCDYWINTRFGSVIVTLLAVIRSVAAAQPPAVASFAGNAQHTAIYQAPSQNLNTIHWSTTIDFNTSGAQAHYGAPLITSANTVIVPVKTANNGFRVQAFNGATGGAKYTLSTNYILPAHGSIPVYQPTLAAAPSATRLYYAGAGGTIYYIDNPDSAAHGTPVRKVFYTTLSNYLANAAGFNSTIFINTPITADGSGNIFLGFRVQGTAPAPLNTTQSGFARIDASGNASYVLAGSAANDGNIGRDSHNSAPALSDDETTLYVVVKSSSTQNYGYLLGLDSTTLSTKYKVFLKDPRNGNNAVILDDSTASPTVAPDGDVYFGIMSNPDNGSRGFLLRFSSDLSVEKVPGGFGWDYTAAIVPATMVPSYSGRSSYLIFSKYNNYAIVDGNGVNRIALLDPNATQVDPHSSAKGIVEMREVLTILGPTPDEEFYSSSYPYAVREWCINTAAVNPPTNSIFTPSEDGHLYRWNLVTNSLSQVASLSPGVGERYVPTIIGPDGTVYTLNGGTLFALGNKKGVDVALTSSVPDTRSVIAGRSLTFTAAVTHTGAPGLTPSGTVTFRDLTYQDLTPITTTLASNVALDSNGQATVDTSSLTAGGAFLGNHFITAIYSGDANFSGGSATLIQKIHASGSTTRVSSSPNPSGFGEPVTFTAMVTSRTAGAPTPSGMITFRDGSSLLAQRPLSRAGSASFNTSTLRTGSHTINAVYSSDTVFASSSGNTKQTIGPSPTPSPIQVTVQTNPTGLSFSVDSTVYTNTRMFSWVPGSSHTIATTSPQSGGVSTRYVWKSWSGGGAISHSVTPTKNTTYAATFNTQYHLTMSAGTGGKVSPSSGWRNSGAAVSITATAAPGYTFSNWIGSGNGSFSGATNPASIVMGGPITEGASFSH